MKRFTIVFVVFILGLTLLLPSISQGATKKALLIGIGTYKNLPYLSKSGGQFNHLRGPSNDVRIIKEALISRYDFQEEEIKILVNHEATRDNIINSFESWLIEGTKEGDLAIFYFSGHGTRVPDLDGDEIDGWDEAFCPYDMVPGARSITEGRFIIDDEIGMMLRRLQKRDVVFIVDSCYSGGMTRNIGGVAVSHLEETPAIQAKFIISDIGGSATRGKAPPRGTPSPPDIPEGTIFISASKKNQLSYEISMPGTVLGAFTISLVEGMKSSKTMSYVDLHEYARKVVKDRFRLNQDPQIEPEKGKPIKNLAFSLTQTILSQLKPEAQKPELEKPKPPVSPVTSDSATVKPQPARPQGVKPDSQKPPELKPEAPPPPKPVQKPEPPRQEVKPPAPAPVAPIPPPAPSEPEKPSLAPQPLPEIQGEKVLVKIEPLQGVDKKVTRDLQERLKGFKYVEVVEDDSFDRLVRGEIREGEYHVRILNRIGDVVKIAATKSPADLAKQIAPHLEYAYLVKQLAYISHPKPPFKVAIEVSGDRRDYRIGEKITYTVSCEEDCYLLMLNLDSKGNFAVIFPNKFEKNNFVKAGKKVQVPDQEMKRKRFELQFFPPAGEETVKVIATNRELRLEGLDLSDFQKMFKHIAGSATTESSSSRALAKEIITVLKENTKDKEFRWSEDTVVVRSHGK